VFEFFKRLFPNNKEGGFSVDQATLEYPSREASTVKRSLSRTKYRVATCQSTGMERAHNEDTLFTFNTFLDGIDHGVSFGIYLVADGMGGHQSGEVASNLAAQGASQYLIDRVFDTYLFDQKVYKEDDVRQLVRDAVDEAQILILRRVPGGGTTLTLVMALGDQLFSAHVGDSRLYVIGRDGKMKLITKDHSLVKRLVDLGEITEAEAGDHPQRNVLYRALGQTDDLEADISQFAISVGERIMLCSDGLWGVLGDRQLKDIVAHSVDLDQMACDLVKAANEAGGPDNISVVLVERMS
jgi:protein phosphatase